MKSHNENVEFPPLAAAATADAALIDSAAAVETGVRSRIADFVELAKLRLNFLVLVTTMVGYAMVPHVDWTKWGLLLHTLIGTTAASASILNQYVELPYDALMNRTKRRPLPAGRVAPIEALTLGVVTGVLGLVELYFFVNGLTALIGAATLASYVFLYTPLKRVTTFCTVIGAIPGALPPVMGVAAAGGSMELAIALFGILFFWQMPHFLAIAILYREDYARGGFKMLPVLDENLTATSRQMVFYTLALIPVTMSTTLIGATGLIYFIAALLMGLAFLGFAVMCVMTRKRGDARQVFLASIMYLPCLLAAMMMDKMQ